MADLAGAVMAAIKPFGMTAAASGLVSGAKAASREPFHFAHWPQAWIDRYLEQQYLLVDPIPRWARNSGRAVSWRELFKILPERDPGREAIAAAAEFGFTEGFVVPMRSGDNSLGLVSFGGDRGPFAHDERALMTLIAVSAFTAADRIVHRGEVGQAAPILTAREIECIALMVRGHPDAQIGVLLGLSVRTVRFHLSNARTKFHVSSRTHLAALAVAQGYAHM
ncbi:MAG: LuxR family transcriptional regulator [Proteobacteria bacterium]|nr:LuxR family transcriptional regulator [Pseudomonadota bacterium]